MKKTNYRSFTAGLLCGAMFVSLCVPGLAAQTVKSLEAYYKNIGIKVDGNMIDPTDANGNPVEPFIVDGTTYLPVRAAAEALGAEVDWDSATDTVLIESGTTSNAGDAIFLDETARVSDTGTGDMRTWNLSTDYDVAGLQYNHSLVATESETLPGGTYSQYVQYDLNREYSSLTGKIAAMQGLTAETGVTHQIMIYGDEELLYTSPKFSNTFATSYDAFNVDVSSVGVVKIEMVSERVGSTSKATGLAIIQPQLIMK